MAKRFVLIVPLGLWLDHWRRSEDYTGPSCYELEPCVVRSERAAYPCVLPGHVEAHSEHRFFPLKLCRIGQLHVVCLSLFEAGSLECLCGRWRLCRWGLGKCDRMTVPVRVEGDFSDITVHVQAEKLREWLKACCETQY